MRNFKHRIKNLLIWFQNIFIPTETIIRSKSKWNSLAEQNAKYFVLSEYGENVSEKEFDDAGLRDYDLLIEGDQLLKDKLGDYGDKKVLEVGCGLGRLTKFLGENFRDVYGTDISEVMIGGAKKRLEGKNNIHLSVVDGVNYPFIDNFFDLVFSFIVFQHMPNKEVVRRNLEEVIRVLKPGGIAKIQLRGVPVKKSDWFYGPAFKSGDLEYFFNTQNARFIKKEGEGQKYFWIWLEKNNKN